MFQVKSDLSKNRLYIKLAGAMNEEEVRKAADAVIEEAKKMKSGFFTINDISEFKPLTQDTTKELTRAQEFLTSQGCTKVIRVIGSSSISNMQLNRTGGYKADVAGSVEDAEKILDQMK